MDASLEGRYSGRIDPDNDNGGTCDLELAGGRFELRIVVWAPYSIEDGTTLRGTYTETADAVILHAREHYGYHWETVKQEHTAPSSRELVAAFAGPGAERTNVLDILIDVQRPVLLLRQSLQMDAPQHFDLPAWFDAACAQRSAETEAQQILHCDGRAVADAAAAFQAQAYTRVVALLEPREERLSPVNRKKLAFARRQLKETK